MACSTGYSKLAPATTFRPEIQSKSFSVLFFYYRLSLKLTLHLLNTCRSAKSIFLKNHQIFLWGLSVFGQKIAIKRKRLAVFNLPKSWACLAMQTVKSGQ
jgi:hypothetical protein